MKKIIVTCFLILLWTACASEDNGSNVLSEPTPDGSLSSGGEYNPVSSNDPIASGDEECENVGTVSISPTSIDFGLSEIDHLECKTISVTSCMNFSAEVDSSSSTEFALYSASGSEITGRASNQQDSVLICYKRSTEGTHNGRVNVVVDNGGAPYAAVIQLSGQTVPALFQIAQPTDGQLVWEHDGISTYDSATSSFVIPVSGTINSQLDSIISSFDVKVQGGNTSVTVDASSHSFSTTVSIPDTPDVYPIDFSIETTHGTLTKTINVIRYSRPEGSLEVRDTSGNAVQGVAAEDATQTDNRVLTLGVNISNVEVSGPSDLSPVEISVVLQKSDGTVSYYSESESTTDEYVWSDDSTDGGAFDFYDGYFEAEDVLGECDSTFSNPDGTYCIPLPPTADLGRGTNILSATVCNTFTDYESGCVVLTATILVDNDTPIITLTTPTDNQIDSDTAAVVVTGILENFQEYETVVDAEGNESQSCLVKLWLNTSVARDPIMLCDFLTIVANTDGNESSGNEGNIRKATFSYTIPLEGDGLGFNKPTLFTNLMELRAYNTSGHSSIKVVSFQRGDVNKSTFDPQISGASSVGSGSITKPTPIKLSQIGKSGELTSGQMGSLSASGDGTTQNTPIMFHLDSSVLDGSTASTKALIAAIEKSLNDPEDGLKFEAIVAGGPLPGDDNGNGIEDRGEDINFFKDLDIPEGKTFYDLDKETQKKWIWQNLHGTMSQKLLALSWYRFVKEKWGEAESGDLENTLFHECDYADPMDFESGWDVACDSNGNRISTALVPYKYYKYIYEGWSMDLEHYFSEYHIEWPDNCNGLDCDDTVQGVWKVGKITFKENGYLDVDICLVGKGDTVGTATNGCADVADDNEHEPAFWSSMAGIGLTEYGITGLENDPVISLIWNVGKVRINLKDVIQIKKVELEDGSFTNKVVIHKDNIDASVGGDSIQLEPYTNCYDYYQTKYGNDASMPFGCDPDAYFYPVLIDTTSVAGQMVLEDGSGDESSNTFLPRILQGELLNTFKGMIGAFDDELINPYINPTVFPPMPWAVNPIESLEFAANKTDDGLEFVFKEDADDPLFLMTPLLSIADIIIDESGVTFKLPMNIGASGVMQSFIGSNYDRQGHMYRTPSDSTFNDTYPLSPSADNTEPFLSASLNIEEMSNAVFNILWQKGPLVLLDVLSPDTADDLDLASNWSLGIDKVILARPSLNICGTIGGALNTGFSPSSTFPEFADILGDAVHLDISLAKNFSPTLVFQPVLLSDGTVDPDATMIQLALSNIQIDVKLLTERTDAVGYYEIGESVFKIRLDLMLKMIVSYSEDRRMLKVYVMGNDDTPAYVSVVNRGDTYDDYSVVTGIQETLLGNVLGFFGSEYKSSLEADYDPTKDMPSFAVILPDSATDFDIESVTFTKVTPESTFGSSDGLIIVNNTDAAANESCDGVTDLPKYYGETEEEEDTGTGEDDGDTGDDTPRFIDHPLSVAELQAGINANIQSILDDPCHGLGDNAEMLCDNGLKNITFSDGFPTLEFDGDSGYIHFSLGFSVEAQDWLWEAVSTE